MQSDSLNCRWLWARHDKQYWGWLSAKCAAIDSEAAELSSYSILESDLLLHHNTALWSLCSCECSHLHAHMDTRKHARYACRGSWVGAYPFSNTHTYTHPDRMKNAYCELSAGSLSLIPYYSAHPTGTTSLLLCYLSVSHTHTDISSARSRLKHDVT